MRPKENSIFIEDYAGEKIYLYKDYGIFWVDNEDISAERKTLPEIKEYLSQRLEKLSKAQKKKFERIAVITDARYNRGTFVKANITSITDEGERWISFENGEREKKYRSEKFPLDTPANWEKINKAIELRNEAGALMDSLELYQKPELR